MKGRVGAKSPITPQSQGLRSVPNKQQERSRQRDLTKNPWSSEGKRNPSNQRATGIENLFRYALLRKGINFIEQASIGPWSIDFLLPDYMVCVEADGEYWHSSMSARMKDRRKDAWLKNKGYTVYHFDGWEIKQDSDYCVSRMMKAIEKDMEKLVKTIEVEIEREQQSEPEDQERIVVDEKDYTKWIGGKSFSLDRKRSAS